MYNTHAVAGETCQVESVCVWSRYLVDLIDTSEGAACEFLQGHHVEDGGHTALTPTLVVGRQLLQLLTVSVLHLDTHPVLLIVVLQHNSHDAMHTTHNSHDAMHTIHNSHDAMHTPYFS